MKFKLKKMEHIIEYHCNDKYVGKKSQFANITHIRNLIEQTMTHPDKIDLQDNGRTKYYKKFSDTTGHNQKGHPYRGVSVVTTRDCRLVTAYPS